eukprot:SAG11_NODE_33684_length_276_cov_0.474576_1_plen_76_part_10
MTAAVQLQRRRWGLAALLRLIRASRIAARAQGEAEEEEWIVESVASGRARKGKEGGGSGANVGRVGRSGGAGPGVR